MGELKSSGDITNSLLKALNAENGLDLKALTARLSSSEQEALETNLIRGVIEKFTKDGITDFSKVSNTLKDAPFESKRAVEIMGELNKKAPILNNTSSLLEKLTAINPKAKELQQGIGHSVTGALMTMKRNLAVERLKSLLPVLGNDASLKNHIRNAINNAGDLKSVINNLEKIEIKDAPENSTKLLEAFKNEVKALREEAQTGEIKGDGFVVKNGGKLTFMDEAKFELSKELQGKTDLGEKISTSLAWLHSKHPEMFENKRAVKELIDYVLDEPNTIKAGKSENSVYLGKKDDTKIKDIVVDKDSNKIIHANSRKMNASEKKERASEDALHSHTDTKPAGALKLEQDARLARDSGIIPQKDKNTKTINASPHIASGLLGGTANGADENGNVTPEEFAKGFIYALFGSRITAEGVKRVSPELYNKILSISKKPSEEVKNIVDNAGVDKLAKQEKRGIYNVTYNGKFSTPVYKDLEDVEGAVRYAIGNKNKGAKHIEIKHLEDTTKEGYVTKQELLNMGENMRKFIKEYKEPFINDRKARLYEWEDKDGVRFRLVINDIKDKNGGSGIHSAITSTSANDDIITFYSDRNLKEPMKFENPKFKLLDAIDTSSDKVGLVTKVLLNKDISDGVKAKAVNRLTKNKISQGAKTSYISTKNSDNN
ncbi:hypothetical protein UNSW1_1883 [Campylobacter concisus UNSW1]|nr:hypothetical protein UNSW1_1883 [Campylobacter concisus UNSW1]